MKSSLRKQIEATNSNLRALLILERNLAAPDKSILNVLTLQNKIYLAQTYYKRFVGFYIESLISMDELKNCSDLTDIQNLIDEKILDL